MSSSNSAGIANYVLSFELASANETAQREQILVARLVFKD